MCHVVVFGVWFSVAGMQFSQEQAPNSLPKVLVVQVPTLRALARGYPVIVVVMFMGDPGSSLSRDSAVQVDRGSSACS